MASSQELSQESVLTTSGLVALREVAPGAGHQEDVSKDLPGHTLEELSVPNQTTVNVEVRTAWPSSTTSTEMESNGMMLDVATPNQSSVNARRRCMKSLRKTLYTFFIKIICECFGNVILLSFSFLVLYLMLQVSKK